MPHERIAAPVFLITSAHLDLSFLKQLAATVCALRVFKIFLKRALEAVFPKGRRPARRSSKSFNSICFRNHPQNISIGLGSSERGAGSFDVHGVCRVETVRMRGKCKVEVQRSFKRFKEL